MGRFAWLVLPLAFAGAEAHAQQQPAAPPAAASTPTGETRNEEAPPQAQTPGDPTAVRQACIDRLGDFARKSPLFVEALCGNENDIVIDNTTAAVPPLLPENGFESWLGEKRV